MRNLVPGFAIALSALATTPASAQVTAVDPGTIVRALQGLGHKPVLTRDKAGFPLIRSTINNVPYAVYFFDCAGTVRCRTIQFYANYPGAKPGLARINEWNATHRFGRAYVTATGEPRIEMDLDLDDGGISPALFADNVQFWLMTMVQYKRWVMPAPARR